MNKNTSLRFIISYDISDQENRDALTDFLRENFPKSLTQLCESTYSIKVRVNSSPSEYMQDLFKDLMEFVDEETDKLMLCQSVGLLSNDKFKYPTNELTP